MKAKRILLVASDELRRDVLELIFHQLDMNVELVWAPDKEEAKRIRNLAEEAFDIVVGIDD